MNNLRRTWPRCDAHCLLMLTWLEGNVRRTVYRCDANSASICVVSQATQIVSMSFASRALASHHGPTQMGASGPTQIAFSLLV